MRALPVLETRRDALEKCVFCPKLCRTQCPVSNAEPRETLTPWGKMTGAWMAAQGDVPVDPSHASPAWACTGCLACRELCDHRNPVADVLLDARGAFVASGRTAPRGALRVLARFGRHDARTRRSFRAIATEAAARAHPAAAPIRDDATVAVLAGCGYLRATRGEARDAIDAAAALTGEPIAVVEPCCGLPLRLAGDGPGFAAHARSVARALDRHSRVIAVDAGCAHALRRHYPAAGVHLRAHVDVLVELAAAALPALRPFATPGEAPVRWHDPCQLGRGLGVYEAPRAVLRRILGRAPEEFADARERAVCAGAGGLLPSTMPDVARSIARWRVESHTRSGGGRIVTGCAASLRALRAAAFGSGILVEDLATWIARAALGDPSR
jgi:Fe-S oxidoreductase